MAAAVQARTPQPTVDRPRPPDYRSSGMRRTQEHDRAILSMTRVWAFIYCISYVLFPTLKYVNSEWLSLPSLVNTDVMPTTVGLACLGGVMFFLGYQANFFPLRTRVLTTRQLRPRRLWMLWGFAWIGVAGVMIVAVMQYGLDAMLYQREIVMRGQGINLFLRDALVNYSSIFSLLLFCAGSRAIVVIQLVLLLISSFGSRGLIVIFILSLALTISRSQVKSLLSFLTGKNAVKLFLGVGALLATFGLVFLRNSETITGSSTQRAIINTFEEGETFSMVYEYYDGRPLYGKTIFEIRYVFLPRQLFPDKPDIWGKAIFERDLGLIDIYSPDNPLYGPSTVFGQLSELFANFGVFGLLIGMAMWGAAFRHIEKLPAYGLQSSAFLIYLMFYFNVLWIFRHGLLGLVQSTTIPLLLLPIVLLVAYRRGPGPGLRAVRG